MRKAAALLCLSLLFVAPAVALADAAESLARTLAERSDRAVLESPEDADAGSTPLPVLKSDMGASSTSLELRSALDVVVFENVVPPTAWVGFAPSYEPSETFPPSLPARLPWVPRYRC